MPVLEYSSPSYTSSSPTEVEATDPRVLSFRRFPTRSGSCRHRFTGGSLCPGRWKVGTSLYGNTPNPSLEFSVLRTVWGTVEKDTSIVFPFNRGSRGSSTGSRSEASRVRCRFGPSFSANSWGSRGATHKDDGAVRVWDRGRRCRSTPSTGTGVPAVNGCVPTGQPPCLPTVVSNVVCVRVLTRVCV